MDFRTMGRVVIPHQIEVAVFIFVSAGLTAIISSLDKLHLTPTQAIIVTGVINVILAGVKKYLEEKN